MKSAELKLELIAQIISTNDLATLIKIETILNNSDQSILEINEPTTDYIKTEKVYIFNEWQQKRIDIALKQVENGECISDEEAEKEIQIWFKEEEERLGGQ
jgi:predicted transcriptional regulator